MNKRYYSNLSKSNKAKQIRMILKSRRLYKIGKYFTRKKLPYPSKVSPHIIKAQRLYRTKIVPGKTLSQRTGCPVATLNQIVRKGQGAYYSSGSRPSQTPQSWARARLASAVTGGKAARVDFHLIKTCDPLKPAYKLAMRSNHL